MTLDDQIIDGLIDAVRVAAREEVMPRFRRLAPDEIDTKSGPDDIVTEADRAAEAAIAAAARALLPHALIVGEEAVHDDPGLLDRLACAEIAVIIDPVDGTGNFAAGLTLFGVILAVTVNGQTEFGLLYDPVMDDWVMTRRGGGAWFCRTGAPPERLHAPAARRRETARGYVPLFLFPPDERAAIGARFARFGRVASLHCSCHEYRMLALGQADFILSPLVKPWDHAAGVLVVEECGGIARCGYAEGYIPGVSRPPLFVLANANADLDAADLLADVPKRR